jgi:hypothetical protein
VHNAPSDRPFSRDTVPLKCVDLRFVSIHAFPASLLLAKILYDLFFMWPHPFPPPVILTHPFILKIICQFWVFLGWVFAELRCYPLSYRSFQKKSLKIWRKKNYFKNWQKNFLCTLPNSISHLYCIMSLWMRYSMDRSFKTAGFQTEKSVRQPL